MVKPPFQTLFAAATEMNTQAFTLGVITTAVVFGPFFLAAFAAQRSPATWREAFATLQRSLSWPGLAWSVALPTGWIVLFYGLVIHVWLRLGSWPRFGQQFEQGMLRFHETAVWVAMSVLFATLWILPVVFVGCLAFRRWRHVSVYALTYGAAVGVAFGVIFLAPHEFLNWFFD